MATPVDDRPIVPTRSYPLRRFFPNMVTLAGLCCGLTSIRYTFSERWDLAIILLLVAAVLDGMDGRIARMLKSTSNFGAQLDSLSDFLCFGVAPALMMYWWGMNQIKGVGWVAAMFFAICCVLRLARFNTHLDDDKAPWQEKFFTGIPSPAGGMLCITPIVLSFEFGPDIVRRADIIIPYVIVIGFLMASRIPTFSAKRLRINHHWVMPIMLLAALYITLLIVEPWRMFWVTTIGYLLLIPVSAMRYRAYKMASE